MKKDIITSAIGILVLTLLLGIVYPLVVTGVSQVAFPGNANGQKVYVGGKLVGSKIIGQQLRRPRSSRTASRRSTRTATRSPPRTRATSRAGRRRPSRPTTPPRPRSRTSAPTATPPSRRSPPTSRPTSRSRSPTTRGLTAAKVPVDAANSSASGIDPDISVANADIQAHRVAAVRHLSLSRGRRADLQVHGRARARVLR